MNRNIITILCMYFFVMQLQAQDCNFLHANVAFEYKQYDSVFLLLPASNVTNIYEELRGKTFMAQGKNAEAIQCLLNSQTTQSNFYLACLYAKQGNVDSAFLCLSKHLLSSEKLSYHKIMAEPLLESLYNTYQWKEFWKQDYYSKEELLLESITYNFEQHNPQKVLDDIQEISNPSVQIRLFQALAFAQTENLPGAEHILKSLSENDCKYFTYNKFQVEMALNANSEAYESLLNFRSSHNQRVDSEYELALLAFRMQNYSKALQHITLYLSFYYADDKAWYLQALILESQELYLDALTAIQKAFEINKNNANYYFTRGNLYLDIKQFESAEYDYNMSLDLNPQLEVYFNRGQVRRYQGNTHGACLDFTRSYKLGNQEALFFKNKYCGRN